MVETFEMETGEHAILVEENYDKVTEAKQLERFRYPIGSSSEWHQISVSFRDLSGCLPN